MKKGAFVPGMLLLLLVFGLFSHSAQAVMGNPPCITPITLSIDPSSAPADTATGFAFYTLAAEAGGGVQFDMFTDRNSDGIMNEDEGPLFSKVIYDNTSSAEYDPLTTDADPADRNITTLFNPLAEAGGYLPVGVSSIRVMNSCGQTATAQFTIADPQVAAPFTIHGTVYEQNTSTPVPYATVFADNVTNSQTGSVAFADINGAYTLRIPYPGRYEIDANKYSYIAQEVTAEIIDADITDFNVYLIPSDSQITGTLTEYGSGRPVWGTEVDANSTSGIGTGAFTDIYGNYTIHVLSGMAWDVWIDDDITPGYFAPQIPGNNYADIINVNPPATVDFVVHGETAWMECNVKDEYGAKDVEGVLCYANSNSSDPVLKNLSNAHYTDASGHATIGLNAGDWSVGTCMNCHAIRYA